MLKCPECSSEEIEIKDVEGSKCIICKKCSYNEAKQLDVFPEDNKSQKEKGRYNVYKTGGHGRAN